MLAIDTCVDTPTVCEAAFKTNEQTCDRYCQAHGLQCAAAWDDEGETCQSKKLNDLQRVGNGCGMVYNTQICRCTPAKDTSSTAGTAAGDVSFQKLGTGQPGGGSGCLASGCIFDARHCVSSYLRGAVGQCGIKESEVQAKCGAWDKCVTHRAPQCYCNRPGST